MGNYLTIKCDSVPLNAETCELIKCYKQTTLRELKESYDILLELHGSLNEADEEIFEEIFGFWMGDSEPHFKAWAGKSGKVSVYQTFAGITGFCNAKFQDKLLFIFNLFDFNMDGVLSQEEIILLIQATVKGLCTIAKMKLNLSTETTNIVKLAKKTLYDMDEDGNNEVSSDEFCTYVLQHREVLKFIHSFTERMDIDWAVEELKKRWAPIEKQFHSIALNNLAKLEPCVEMLKECVSIELTHTEIIALTDTLDVQGHVGYFAFKAVGTGLIAFDLVDRARDNFVHLLEFSTLIHIKQGNHPDPQLLAEAVDKLHAVCTGEGVDEILERLEWLKHCAPPKKLSSGYYDKFSQELKNFYDQHDKDLSGKLTLLEFSSVLYNALLSLCPDSLMNLVDQETHAGKNQKDRSTGLLQRMARSLALEIFDRVGISEHVELEWLKLKVHLSYLWDRTNTTMRWLYDHQTDHFARIFTFDEDESGHMDEEELSVVMLKSLGPALRYHIVTKAEAVEMAHKAARDIIQRIDDDDNKVVCEAELRRNLHVCLEIENEMLNEVERVRAAKIEKSLQQRHSDFVSHKEELKQVALRKEAQKTYEPKTVVPPALLANLEPPKSAPAEADASLDKKGKRKVKKKKIVGDKKKLVKLKKGSKSLS